MIEKLYSDKTEKDLKFALNLYNALLVVSIMMPILFSTFSYITDGKINLIYLIPFVCVFVWSLFNINYLKKRVKNKKIK